MPGRRIALALLAAAALAGCGSEDDPLLLAAPAGPASSPPQESVPEGDLVEVGNRPEGVAFDPRTGRVAVLVRDPDALVLLDGTTLEEVERVTLTGPPEPRTLVAGDGEFRLIVDPDEDLFTVDAASGAAESTDIGLLEDPGPLPALVSPALVAGLGGGELVLLDERERTLAHLSRLSGETSAGDPAGVGPTHVVAGDDRRVYVTDTGGESVLLFRAGDEFKVARRYGLPGAPYATTIDREKGKLWVTLTGRNEVVQLTGDAQPREQRRYATVAQPDAIAIDERTGRVFVAGRDEGVLQAFDGYAQEP